MVPFMNPVVPLAYSFDSFFIAAYSSEIFLSVNDGFCAQCARSLTSVSRASLVTSAVYVELSALHDEVSATDAKGLVPSGFFVVEKSLAYSGKNPAVDGVCDE